MYERRSKALTGAPQVEPWRYERNTYERHYSLELTRMFIPSRVSQSLPITYSPVRLQLKHKKYYAGARLCALQKGQNDVRPIAAGETLRRMVSKAACSVVKSKASTLFQGRQYGVATASGSERVIHLCRQVVESTKNDPEFVLCKVDLRNAFNTVSRAAFISLSEKHFPELTPWINWCYATDSALTYGSQTVASTEGVQQGDPLGPLLFSMVLREITELIENEVPSGLLLHLWYLDDGVLAGKSDSVRRALDAIACAGPQWGLHLNASKLRDNISSGILALHGLIHYHPRQNEKSRRKL